MKRVKSSFIFFVSLLVLLPGTSFALVDDSKSAGENKKTVVGKEAKSVTSETTTKDEKLKEQALQRKEQLGKLMDGIVSQYSEVIDRIDDLSARVETRIKIMANQGGIDQTAEARLNLKLEEVRKLLDGARDDLLLLRKIADSTLTDNLKNQGQAIKRLRQETNRIKSEIKKSHKLILDIIMDVKQETSKLDKETDEDDEDRESSSDAIKIKEDSNK